jgi:peroxiredoxin (alkyl hydroperoxide reductase subunit C)
MKTIKLMFIVLFCSTMVWAQSEKRLSIPLIGSEAPSFKANSTDGVIKFPKDFGKSWKILYSHPKDFTPVCTSEIIELAHLQDDFNARDVKVAVISTDNVTQHQSWKGFMERAKYKDRDPVKINFPLFEDVNGAVSIKYGMLHEIPGSDRNIRGVYIIDSENVVRSINFYPVEIGRNMDEILRTVVALQTSDKEKVLTPANWNEGDDVITQGRQYRLSDYEANPEKYDKEYYSLENMIWFKRGSGAITLQSSDVSGKPTPENK